MDLHNNRDKDVPVIFATVTYLEMVADPRVPPVDLGEFVLQRLERITVAEYLGIYRAVGRQYLWSYRPGQSDDEIQAILDSPATRLYGLYRAQELVGLAELDAADPLDVELVHFGLIPRYVGQGLGKLFLANILSLVWSGGIHRLWLSTCAMDHRKSVPFYQAAGFSIFKTRLGQFYDWRFTGFYDMTDAPQIPFGDVRNRGPGGGA